MIRLIDPLCHNYEEYLHYFPCPRRVTLAQY
jgi:hypothetical protein